MRQLSAGLAIMALAVTGCAATTATSSGRTPAAGPSHSATAPGGLGGLHGGGAPGPAQWVVDGTMETDGSHAQPLSGVVTFRDTSSGHTVTVTVGPSGRFSLGLVAGTYTATGQTRDSKSSCSPPATVTVRAGQLTRLSVVCKAS